MAARLTGFVVVVIVAATLVAGLIVGQQRTGESGPVHLIIYNGKVYPADGSGLMAEAIAIQGNRILQVGSTRDIRRLRRPQTKEIDAGGASVLPGFNDGHARFLNASASPTLNLLDAGTLEQVQQQIRAFAADRPSAGWIEGEGWSHGLFPGGLPTRQQLDALVPDRPALMTCFDGQTSWVNSKALQLAGITRRTPNPPGGIIVKDNRGEPTGVLKESAQALVRRLVTPPTESERLDALRQAVAEAHQAGITSVQTIGGTSADLELLDALRDEGELSLRVYHTLSVDPSSDEAAISELDAVRERYPDDPLLKTGAVTVDVDGTIASHTAAMLAPYANRTSRGLTMFTPEQLQHLTSLLDQDDWQILMRARGDRGVRLALDAYAHVARTNPAPARGRRHRIEHVEAVDAADIPRFESTGVIASVQPTSQTINAQVIDVWLANVGRDRASRGWPYERIRAAGGRLVLGSDWPLTPADPLAVLHTSIYRMSGNGVPPRAWHSEEGLSLEAAVDAYTSGAAYASFDEHRKGVIAPDMLADLTILSHDIFSDPTTLAEAVVTTTIFDGQVVYEGSADTPSTETTHDDN